MKKGIKFLKVFVVFFVFLFSLSVFALDVQNLNGVYTIDKVGAQEDYTTIATVDLKSVKGGEGIAYQATPEERGEGFLIDFYYVGGKLFAKVISKDGEKCYQVVENKFFYLKMVNVEDETDVLELVYDRYLNNFDYEGFYNAISKLSGDALREKLQEVTDHQKALGYTGARKAMFSSIDNFNGIVEGVYTGKTIRTHSIPNTTVMNTEHTWPQSKFGGAEKSVKKCDLFHLFPTDSRANSIRSSYNFGEVVKVKKQLQGGSKLGYDKEGRLVFEPRDCHKGNVARAIFYFAVRYGMHIKDFEEEVLRKWNKQDPVDEKELKRNSDIEDRQHTRNPFIDHPEFIDKIANF